jgi:hypothetical protein
VNLRFLVGPIQRQSLDKFWQRVFEDFNLARDRIDQVGRQGAQPKYATYIAGIETCLSPSCSLL